MMIAFLLVALSGAPDCSFDRAALLALDQNSFDQDLSGGWRAVANRPGCGLAAANLLRDYRLAHPESPDLGILYWHEGQTRAIAGEARAAVPLLELSRKPTDGFGWNAYVDATVAFLKGDRMGLQRARQSLAALPVPPDWDQTVADAQAKAGRRLSWPLNLDVVDGLMACFDKPYREAYGGACRRAGAGAGQPAK